ncbi:MAG: MATE family efflux transporter [Prevotellaceae bacterium]|nr:MATE family efflux transporter [Prevotellaceae bacterium]
MQGTRDLTQGTIRTQLFRLAMPIIATSFIQMAYSLTDMAWLGRLGSEAVAAVGGVGMLTWMAGSIALLNKTGSEVSVGQAVGKRDFAQARHFASHNVTMALLISLLCAAVLFLFARPIVGIYRLELSIADAAVAYLRVVSTALPFVFLSYAFTGIYNGVGRSSIPFYMNGTGLLTNIILDPLFIFGFGWGTEGAAYATWLSQAIVFALFIYQLRSRNVVLDRFPFIERLQRSYAMRIVKIGLPVATFNTMFSFVNMFLGRTASALGGHIGLMALTTGGQIESVTWNTSQGFSTALSTFVAQNYAAGKRLRVTNAYYTTLWITAIVGGVWTILFYFYGNEIFSIFVPEPDAYRVGGDYLRIDAYSQLLMMMEISTQGIFYGLGRTWAPAIVSMTFTYMRIPLALFLASVGFGVDAIWWAISISSITKGVVLTTWFFIVRKRW